MNFTQSSIFSIVASFGLLFVNLLINIIEARIMGPSEMGRYQVFVTTQTMFATICALGIGQSCIYFINKLKIDERKVLATSINSALLISLLAGIVLFGIILLDQEYFGKENVYYIALFSMGTSAMLINNIFTPVLLTHMEVVRNQVVKYFGRIFTLIAFALLFLLGKNLSVGFLLGLSGVTTMLGTIILYYYFYNRFSFSDGIDFPLLGRILKWGVKLAGSSIASITLTSIPVYFLTWFSSTGFEDVGYYGRANSLLVVGTVIASSIGPLLYAKWSSVEGKILASQVRRVSMLFIMVNILIAIGIIVVAPFVVELLFGKEFNAASPILQILAFSLIGNGVKEVCYGVLSSQGHPLKIMKNLCYGIILSVVANYFVIPVWGVCGCAMVTTIVTLVTAIFLMYDVTRISEIKMSDFFVAPTINELKEIITKNILKK